jgi:hypothetical protein
MTHLERASLLDPGKLDIWLDLGRLCLETGQRSRGRGCYVRAGIVAPDDVRAQLALGAAWRWEWLSSFDDSALARARQSMERAAALAPERAAAWSELAALELVRGRLDLSLMAARRAQAADPAGWQPLIALACVSYRSGEMARADSAFRLARPRLPLEVRRRFGISTWRPAGGGEVVSWSGTDPDLTTPEHEAELDYLTRVSLAVVLFRDANGLRWDMRTELFVRYGPPAAVDVNPLSSPLAYQHNRYHTQKPAGHMFYTPPPLPYPYNVQAWSYPELGIRAELWDRSLTQSFELPVALQAEADPRPDPALLASRPDLVAMGGGRGVFRAMAPGSIPIAAQATITRFPSDQGAILVAHLITAGEPTDTLRGTWAVVAMDGHVLTRGSGSLSASSCDPTGKRVVDFTVAAPPGAYRVDLTVTGSGGRRGLVRLPTTIARPGPSLALSDLVMLCGMQGASVTPEAVRIEPDMDRRVTGSRPLMVYFEIDHLSLGTDGGARFTYTYSIHPVKHEQPEQGTAPVAFEASREESHDGTRRRQFVTVPMRSIRSGAYDLRIHVLDHVAGTVAEGTMRFVKE